MKPFQIQHSQSNEELLRRKPDCITDRGQQTEDIMPHSEQLRTSSGLFNCCSALCSLLSQIQNLKCSIRISLQKLCSSFHRLLFAARRQPPSWHSSSSTTRTFSAWVTLAIVLSVKLSALSTLITKIILEDGRSR